MAGDIKKGFIAFFVERPIFASVIAFVIVIAAARRPDSSRSARSQSNKPPQPKPSKLSMLIENPNACMIANGPTKATGIVIAGIKVARQLCTNT